MTLEGDTAKCRYEHSSAGVLQPSYDGNLLFTGGGIYSADLKTVLPEQFRGVVCFPSYHPAYFLGFSGQGRGFNPRRTAETAKLSLYSTGDKRLLISSRNLTN